MYSIRYSLSVSTSRPYQSTLREERALETRLRIRKSARKLFAAKGLTETTINEIAEDAGVAPQTVYSVFGSKGGIVAAILEDLQETAGESTCIAEIVSQTTPTDRCDSSSDGSAPSSNKEHP